MTMTKPKLRFSRKLLAIPYALFLLVFVVAPLFIIIYYAFTNGDTGKLSFENFQNFFSGSGGQTFFESSRFKTIVQSFGISIASTLLCLLIASFVGIGLSIFLGITVFRKKDIKYKAYRKTYKAVFKEDEYWQGYQKRH